MRDPILSRARNAPRSHATLFAGAISDNENLQENDMKTMVSGLLALSVLAGAAGTANAASTDCKVTGWVEGGQGGRPIFSCPDSK